MVVNQIKVRRKENARARDGNGFYIFVGLAIALGAAAIFVAANFSEQFNFAAPLAVVAEGNRQIIRVPKGGDLQAALKRAQSGDVIELQAGATYYGEIKLPNKPLTDYVTIQTSKASELPADARVKAADADLMAKIVSKGGGAPAVSTENGAHHYRFVGIEFTPDSADYIYNLVFFGDAEGKSNAPRDLEIDRCYFHPNKAGKTRRGLALNSQNTVVKNSRFEGFAYPNEETQAVAGWTGTKNVKLLNNHLEGGAENVIFGGGDPLSADLIPSDIEMRANYFFKPAAWKGCTIKNAFELKDAKRVEFVGNYIDNNGMGAGLVVTVRNQDGGAPFSVIEDVLLKDNLVANAEDGINILGTDNIHPSGMLKRLTVAGNLFLDAGGRQGLGYFVQISSGDTVSITNNTAFNNKNPVTLYDAMPKNFIFRDNIVRYGEYGIHGHRDIKSADAQKMFQNNVFIDDRQVNSSGDASSASYSFPPGNSLVRSFNAVGFLNFAQNDFRLAPASRYKGKGKDKTDIGANLDAAAYAKVKSN